MGSANLGPKHFLFAARDDAVRALLADECSQQLHRWQTALLKHSIPEWYAVAR
jgi:hypothetical protein